MPEAVKPVWIDGYYDNETDAREAAQEGLKGAGLEGLPIRAMTLDQIKAWLENVLTATPGEISPALWRNGRESFKCDLLAQVQAWRTQPTTPGASHE